MAGMDAQSLVRREIVGHNLAPEFDEGLALPGQLLQEKAVAAKDPHA